MITKEIISKTFDNIILKSGHNYKLSDGLNESFKKFRSKYGKDQYENVSLFDKEGNHLHYEKGELGRVEIEDEIVDNLVEENGSLHAIHNHRIDKSKYIPTCLSVTDLNHICDVQKNGDGYNYKSITAISSNGSYMRIIRGDKFNKENHKTYKQISEKLKKGFKQYNDNFLDLREKYSNEYIDEVSNKKGHFTQKDIITCENKADVKVYKEMGGFENTDEFKKIKNDYRNIGCKLTIGWE